MELNKIFLGDCLEILKQIPSNSIDAVITDIYSDNSLDSLSSLIMLSHLKVEMVYQCQ